MEALWNVIDTALGLSTSKAEELNTFQVCLRAVVVYLVLIGFVRVAKKTISQPSYRVRRRPRYRDWLDCKPRHFRYSAFSVVIGRHIRSDFDALGHLVFYERL